MVSKHPDYLDMVAEAMAVEARLDALMARDPKGYWHASARKHFESFRHAYKQAHHEVILKEGGQQFPAEPPRVPVLAEEDMF